MTETCEIQITVNDEPLVLRVHPMSRLLDVLRDSIGLTGTKEGCGEGECGSCAVLLDGALVNSCLVPVIQANGKSVITIEGIAKDPKYAPLIQEFACSGATQCGMCTPGMIMAAVALLSSNPKPTPEQVREAMSGNICRCTGYAHIVDAIVSVSEVMS